MLFNIQNKHNNGYRKNRVTLSLQMSLSLRILLLKNFFVSEVVPYHPLPPSVTIIVYDHVSSPFHLVPLTAYDILSLSLSHYSAFIPATLDLVSSPFHPVPLTAYEILSLSLSHILSIPQSLI